MPKILDILLEEHQNIQKFLLVREHELEVFDRGERPDYEILQTNITSRIIPKAAITPRKR